MFTRSLRPLACLAAALLGCGSASAAVIFVDASQNLPTALQTGASWATAFKSLQSALAVAGTNDEIWVAEGFYKPTTTTSRTISFVIPSNVKLFGGFAGTETDVHQRDPATHVTVLTGDIGVVNNPADNSFHVLNVTGSNVVVSGFHITGGNANGPTDSAFGGGLRLAGTNIAVHGCRIYGNTASGAGAAILGIGTGTFRVTHCIITDNPGSPGTLAGGAVEFQNASPQLYGCVIVGNPAGGAVRFMNTIGADSIANCIIRDNVGAGGVLDAQVMILGGSVSISGNNIQGGAAFGLSGIDADPKFADADGKDGIPGNGDDNYALRGDSPCIDRGNTTLMPPDDADVDGDGQILEFVPLDLAGVTRRIDDPLATATGAGVAPFPDIGAYEYDRPRTILVDQSATGANTGVSWTDAYTDLQSAIAELTDIKFGGPGEIWVANGTYKPSASDPLISFQLPRNVKIYGGFAGGELSRAARNPRTNETILSGELGAAGPTGNSRSVVTASGALVDENTILDGFTIRDGAIQNSFVAGTGVFLQNDAHPTVGNCRIVNHVNSAGAPVFLSGFGSATPTFINCVVAGNVATSNGFCGIVFTGSSGRVYNSVIAGNSATNASNPAVRIINAPATIRNCILFANTSAGSGAASAQISAVGTTPLISHCAIQNWFSGAVPGAIDDLTFDGGTTGQLVDGNGADNLFGTADDDYHPITCSDLVDAGAMANMPTDVGDLDDDGVVTEEWPVDYASNNRLVDLPAPNVIVGAQGRMDIGVIEVQTQTLASADFNGDGFVDAADLAILLGAWNASGTEFDLTGDCFVNASDLAVLLGAWS